MTDSPHIPRDPARFWALIPCAGSGSRAIDPAVGGVHAELPKQYQPVNGVPMVEHTLAAFAAVPRIAGTVVVVAAGDDFLSPSPASRRQVLPCGGASRAASVLNGLLALQAQGVGPDDWVLVHDAARCLVTPGQIDGLIDACREDAVGGLLAVPLADTLKVARDGRVESTLAREDKWLAQTPQMFRLGPLMDALGRAGAGVTDEAGAIEAAGLRPRLVPGSSLNFKITWPQDFALAEAILRQRAGERPRSTADDHA
jgi:2-C-methyl-D-erythritol 4-phosphate cytidylyltransferase